MRAIYKNVTLTLPHKTNTQLHVSDAFESTLYNISKLIFLLLIQIRLSNNYVNGDFWANVR